MENQYNAPQQVPNYSTATTSPSTVPPQSTGPGTVFAPQVLQEIPVTQPIIPLEDNVLESEYQKQASEQLPTPVSTKLPSTMSSAGSKKFAFGLVSFAVLASLLAGGFILRNANKGAVPAQNLGISDQSVDVKGESIDALQELTAKGSEHKIIVNGDIITTSGLSISNQNSLGQIVINPLSSDRKYTFPNASGVICLDSNNCNYALANNVVTSIGGKGGAITLGVGLTLQGNTLIASTGSTITTLINGRTGSVVVNGVINQTSVSTNGNVVTIATAQDIAKTSVPTFQSINLTTAGTQNGNTICDQSNNCGFSTVTGAYVQGGNSFGANAVLGTNDTYDLVFRTDSIDRLIIDTAGNVGISATSNGAKLYTPYQNGDVGGVIHGSGYIFGSGGQALIIAGDMTNSNDNLIAIAGESYSATAITGSSVTGSGVYGESQDNYGVSAVSINNSAMFGLSVASGTSFAGVQGMNWNDGYGVRGDGVGLFGPSNAIGVGAFGTNNYGLYASSSSNTSAYFQASKRTPTCFPFVCPVPPPDVYPTQPTVVIQQFETRTENLLELQLSDNTPVFQIGYNGHTAIGSHATIDMASYDVFFPGIGLFPITDSTNVVSVSEVYTAPPTSYFGVQTGVTTNTIVDYSSDSDGLIYGISNNVNVSSTNTGFIPIVTGSNNHVKLEGSGVVQVAVGVNNTVDATNLTGGSVNGLFGSAISVLTATDSLISQVVGEQILIGHQGTIGYDLNNATGLRANVQNLGGGSQITDAVGIEVASNTGDIVNNYGLVVVAQTAGQFDYGVAIQAADTQTLWLGSDIDGTASAEGIAFGASRDTTLYRSAADTLKTDDNLIVSQDLTVTSQIEIGDQGGTLAECDLLFVANFNCTAFMEIAEISTETANNTYGIRNSVQINPASANSAANVGIETNLVLDDGASTQNFSGINIATKGAVANATTGTTAYTAGGNFGVTQYVAGTITSAIGVAANNGIQAAGTIATSIGLQAGSANLSGGGTITNNYGIWAETQTVGTSDYGIRVDTADTQTLWIAGNDASATTAAKGIAFGSSRDVNLYRSAADTLKTDDALSVGSGALISSGAAGNIGLVVQGAASQTANLQEWQGSAGTVLASISAAGDLTVANATVNGTLTVNGNSTFNGHIITGNSSGSTSVAAGAGAGAGGGASVTGNDTSGKVTITTGTGSGTGVLGTVTFAHAYGGAPNVILTPADGNGSSIQYFAGSSSTTTFTIDTNNAPTDGTTYTYYYHVMQ